MLRQTNYGLWVDDDGEKNENEKAIDYIVECAKSVGIEVIPGKTALSICFIAEVLKGVKAQEQRTGHWNIVSDGYGDNAYICECSECKDTVWVYKDADRKWNYCPNCGAKMEG